MPVYTEDKATSALAKASYTISASDLTYALKYDAITTSKLESKTACTNIKIEQKNEDGDKNEEIRDPWKRNISICRRENTKQYMEVDRVVFNDPATIVFWKDGTKTVVKCAKGTKFDKYAGFCAAVTKRVYENNSLVNKIVKNGYEEPKKDVKISRSKGLKDSKDNKNVKKEKKNG